MSDKKKKEFVGVNKPLGGDIYVEFGGGQYAGADIRKKCLARMEEMAREDGVKLRVNRLEIYVVVDEGKAYFTAETSEGEITGDVVLAGQG